MRNVVCVEGWNGRNDQGTLMLLLVYKDCINNWHTSTRHSLTLLVYYSCLASSDLMVLVNYSPLVHFSAFARVHFCVAYKNKVQVCFKNHLTVFKLNKRMAHILICFKPLTAPLIEVSLAGAPVRNTCVKYVSSFSHSTLCHH